MGLKDFGVEKNEWFMCTEFIHLGTGPRNESSFKIEKKKKKFVRITRQESRLGILVGSGSEDLKMLRGIRINVPQWTFMVVRWSV